MPKIPTFEAKGRPTAEAPGVTTGIQVSPTKGTAAALLPSLNQLTEYAIKKRDVAEKIQANKKVFEIKGELDKYLQAEKENIDDEDAINNFKGKYNNYIKQELSLIDNKRVKNRIQQNLDLEYSEYVYNLKKNSYAALEKNAIEDINNNITSYTSKYATTDDVKLKLKYKTEAENKIKQFALDFDLPQNVLDKKLKALDKDFLLADFQQFAGTPNGLDAIKFADDTYGGEKTLSNLEFSNAVVESYETAISEITIVGDKNADFDKALDLINEARKVKRSNGFNLNFGETKKKLDTLEQSILNEKITHENRIDYINQGKELNEYLKDQKSILSSSFFNQFSVDLSGTLNKEKSLESQNEFDKRFSNYESINPDATLDEKKEYAVELRLAIQDRYKERDIRDLTNFNLDKNKFELITEEKGIKAAMSSYQRYLKNPKLIDVNNDFYNKQVDDDVRLINRKTVLNGFVDEKGNPDVNLFYNTFIEILNNQKKD